MSEDAFETIQKNLAAENDKEAERRKRLPINLKLGPRGSLQQAGETASETALKRLGYRDYALDHIGRAEFGAFAVGCIQHKLNIVDALEKLATIVPGLKQDRPPADAGVIPPLPIEPVTGLRIANPYEGKATAEKARSKEVIKTWSPRLAKWLEDAAKNQGVSANMLDELQAEKDEAQHMREIKYGQDEWRLNKIRPDSGATLTEQNLFVRSVTDPWLLAFHRREAQLGSPRLKFNLTHRMQAWHIDPKLCEAYKTAEQVFKQWQAEQQEKAA
jgi:hypothetical protein